MINYHITEVKDKLYWVGVVDWSLRDFHGFTTTRGGTYNAFLIHGKEPILVDTVKAPFAREFLGKVAEVTELKKIKHILVNHIEPDHSGSFTEVLKHVPDAKVYASENGAAGLHRYYDFDRPVQIVRSGETLTLGDRVVTFLETPMAHWPDSMVSYLPEEKVLFSSDIFGQLIATAERFDYEIEPPYYDAALYYANIILPFNRMVLKTLEYLQRFDVTPEIILPDHGIFWKDHIGDIVERYQSWASGSCAQGVLIVYDSMWGSTEIMAELIYAGLARRGVRVQKLHIRSNAMSKIVTEIMLSKVILIGTPTINDTVFPPVGQLLAYLKGLRPGRGRLWGTFGSYGWGGGGVEFVNRWYAENQYELIESPLEVRFRPKEEARSACDEYAASVVAGCTASSPGA
jgi:flavorubredoxin